MAASLYIGARPGNFARLRVRDFGRGMNRELLAKAFDPLFTTKSMQGNTGLGLSIVYAIVRAHDGFLTAESHPNKGTTISIYLPIQSDVEQVIEAESKAASGSQDSATLFGNNERILVVEDEPTVRELVASMLAGLGYEVSTCENGHEALKISARQEFDLLLVDMIMPKMRGIDLINQIRSKHAEAKALLMTGYGPGVEPKIRTAIIHKPFDVDTLAKAVRKALDA